MTRVAKTAWVMFFGPARLVITLNQARELLTWIIMEGEGDHPEKLLARPVTAGVGALPYVLVADNLTDLRGKLPSGLTCSERQPSDAPGVVEIWF